MTEPPTPPPPFPEPAAAARRAGQRPWLPWTVAAVVLVAGVGVAVWLVLDRQDLREDVEATAQDLADARGRIAQVGAELRASASENRNLSRGIDTCVRALDDQVDLFNALARELNALRTLNEDQAESFHDRAEELRSTANRSLARCRRAAA